LFSFSVENNDNNGTDEHKNPEVFIIAQVFITFINALFFLRTIMAKETVEALVEGGKATAAPPLGPALGPKGVNIGEVVAEINKKTEAFKGMQVPVKVIIDSDTKAFEISIGTPPAASLIKKEAGVEKGSGVPQSELIADLAIVQVIKIAKMKEDALLGKTMKEKIKEIVGTCNSMGIMVEGVKASEAFKLIDEGKFDKEIKEEKTELSDEERAALEEEKKKLQEELVKKHEEEEKKAKEILASMTGKTRSSIVDKMREAEISEVVINKVVPAEEAAAAPGEGKAEEGKPADAKPEADKKE